VNASTGIVAVVTGGSRGIGLATARALIGTGARVAITGTSDDTLRTASLELGKLGRADAVLAIRADVRHADQVDQAIDTVVRQFGGLDVLVNNAGVGIFHPIIDMTGDDWHRVMDTNLTGVFYCCRAALPRLRARGGGWIINISSLSSTGPFAGGAAYCASKAGLNAFTEALMQEVRQDGIRVACVLPGSVRTGFGGRTPGSSSDEWKLAPDDVAQTVTALIGYPARSLPSRIEIRPSRPPAKG
jgi:NAD(P)-dependent dehydrogenase (short-subunit alcohol dehydrogenase family)